jgi:hypothetical protein
VTDRPAARMTILEALRDPHLFEPHFRDPSWSAWFTLLAALYGLPMTDAEKATYQYHTGRSDHPEQPYDEAAVIVGRRGGKSRILALIATYAAVIPDYTPFLVAGEVPTISIISADRKQARTILRYIKGLLKAIPLLAGMIEAETQESLALTNGVMIEVHTASFRVTRGYTIVLALCDESAFWRTDESSANPDTEILDALRPALGTIPGAMLLLASSPYARRGALYDAYKQYYGQAGAEVLVWKGSSREMNPKLRQSVVDKAYAKDPVAAAAEYGGEFRTDIAAFVAREVVEGCTVPDRWELPWIPGLPYKGFTDPSGGSADSMTLAVAHEEHGVAVLDAVREVRPPFSPDAVVSEFAGLLKSYHLSRVTGDRYAGEWPREKFREYGIGYDLSDRPKSDIYRDTLPLLNSGQVELLDLPRLASQFCGLERRTARGGRDSIDHPPGQHDDLANAVAGALLLSGQPGPTPARSGYINWSSR